MPTCLEIITSGYRKAGIADPRGTLDATDAQVGLELLQDFYTELVSKGTFGRTTQVLVTESRTVEENDRMTINTDDAVTITFPETVTDGEERTVKPWSLGILADADTTTRYTYLYEPPPSAGWVRLDSLTLDSYAPLSLAYPAGLRAMVAVLRAGEEGTLPQIIARQAAMFQLALANKFDGSSEPVENTYF